MASDLVREEASFRGVFVCFRREFMQVITGTEDFLLTFVAFLGSPTRGYMYEVSIYEVVLGITFTNWGSLEVLTLINLLVFLPFGNCPDFSNELAGRILLSTMMWCLLCKNFKYSGLKLLILIRL